MELHLPTVLCAIAERRPEAEALVFRDRRITWAGLIERMGRLASVLRDAGLTGTDRTASTPGWLPTLPRVALYLLNGNEYLEGMIGAWAAKCAPFNVNYRYVAEELAYLLNDAGAEAIIYHARFAPVLAEVLPRLAAPPRLLLVVDDESGTAPVPGSVEYEAALAAADPTIGPAQRASWSPDDLYLCYTGGTTGMPKGVMWRQSDFIVAALGTRRRDGREFESLDEVVAAARGTVRALPAPPLMHGAAHWNALSAWIAGGTVVLQSHPDRLDAADIWSTVEAERVTSLLIVGDPFARPLLDELASPTRGRPYDTSSLRHVLSGGTILSPVRKAALVEALDGLTVVDVLGSSESGRQAVARTGGGRDVGFEPSSTSFVIDDTMTRVLARDDDSLGWLAQSGRVPLGYLGDEAKTARTFPTLADGRRVAVPGDRARWSPEGTIDLRGRDSVCINTGGEKVFAEEVELAVASHPAVSDVVVCGRPSDRWGTEVVAVVSLRADRPRPTVEELNMHAATSLARYKLPKAYVVVDRVERAPSGKADYRWATEVARSADGGNTHDGNTDDGAP